MQVVVPPERVHLTNTSQQWPTNSYPRKTWERNTQGRSDVALDIKLCHTPHQVSSGHHDQADAAFVEERKWCIKETAAANPFKRTEDLSFQSWDKPRFQGAATNINEIPKQHWRKREDDLDGDLYHCIWDSNLTDNVIFSAKPSREHHAT